jgi:hypothetical protein
MSEGVASLPFLAIAFGVLVSGATASGMTKLYLSRKEARGGLGCPEDRLVYAIPAGLVATASIFWLVWSARKNVHWIVPVLSGVPYYIHACTSACIL